MRAFIAEHAPAIPPRAGVRSAESEAELTALQEWTARLYDAGYVGAEWPQNSAGARTGHRTRDHRRGGARPGAGAGVQSGSVLARTR